MGRGGGGKGKESFFFPFYIFSFGGGGWRIEINCTCGPPYILVMTISNDHYGIYLCSTLFFIILRGLDILKSVKTYLDVKKY